jgi:hypothetical protein
MWPHKPKADLRMRRDRRCSAASSFPSPLFVRAQRAAFRQLSLSCALLFSWASAELRTDSSLSALLGTACARQRRQIIRFLHTICKHNESYSTRQGVVLLVVYSDLYAACVSDGADFLRPWSSNMALELV